MWIGSDKGLLSYDGYSMQTHFVPGENSNTRIYCGAIVDSTHIYLGTDHGVLVYNYQKDEYEDAGNDFPPDIRTIEIYDGALWLGTLNGLFTYQLNSHKLSKIGKNLPHQAIYSILRTVDNHLYVGTYDGFCRYDTTTKKFISIKLPVRKSKRNMLVHSLLEDTTNKCIWIGTSECLLKYSLSDGQTEQIDAMRGNFVETLAMDEEKRLLIGTDNGLYIYHDGRIVQHIIHDSRNPHSLFNNSIRIIFIGREQNIWIGTEYGISLAHHNNALYQISLSQITGTGEGNQFYSITRDRNGNFWAGGTNGLLRFTFPTGKNMKQLENDRRWDVTWYKVGDSNYPLFHNRIRQIYEDRDGNIWVASDGSISSYDVHHRQLTMYTIVDSSHRYNANWAYGILEDRQGQLWIATYLGGIFVVDKQKLMKTGGGTYVADKTYTTKNGLSSMYAHDIAMDKSGNIWTLLYNSPSNIEKINPSTGKITHITPEQLNGRKTADRIICSTDGNMWIGYSGGLIIINPSDNSTKAMTFDVFNNCEVLSMIEIDKKVWISTSKGMWVSDIKSPKLRRLRFINQLFTTLYYDSISKKLFMGTIDGFVISTPDLLLENTPRHPLLFTALYVNNKPYKLPQSIRYTKQVELDYDQNNLSFELSDLLYSWEEKNSILYRLEKVDKEWNILPAGTNRITYNNLDDGNYRLVVCHLDTDGKASEEEYALDIHIRPPFYYTPIAKCIYVLAAAALLFWIIRFFRIRNRLRTERAEKEKVLAEARAKMDFFTNLSHDLKTPLSLIIAPLSKLISETKTVRKKEILEAIHTNALRLNALISKILDIKETENESEDTLIRSHIELHSLLQGCIDTFSPLMEERKIELRLESDVDILWLNMDQLKIESIFINLISNAVKYVSDGEGKIIVSMHTSPGEVRVTVADNGTGISEEDLPLVFIRFFQSRKGQKHVEGTGIGLYLVKKY
ncbi:MAG: ATP-binding protein, partial [Prevotella sp.]|nr:ATP-binding protein [Prevotella sp.]